MSYSPEEIKRINALPVHIPPSTYQKMFMHVLRFGSLGIPKDQWRECYGMCIGKFNKDTGITITDALASTHGSDIGVEFMEKNYVLMADFQDQLDKINAGISNPADQVFIVGWYHSHPGMERFLSSVDVRNQIAYQQAGFPFGIAIVFDNTCIFQSDLNTGQLDFGFKIFRLDDPTSTEVNIPFSDVPFNRELLDNPDLIELWKNEMTMIENVQKRGPIIKEYQEAPSVFGDFKLPTTDDLKNAPSGITSDDRSQITVLVLTELDQMFTRGMQLFAEKFQSLSPEQQGEFGTFIDEGITPLLENLLTNLANGLNAWTMKLREDVDKRVNFGIAALNSMKETAKNIQDQYIDYLKQATEASREKSQEASKNIDTIESKVIAALDAYKNDMKTILKEASSAWHELVQKAGKQLGQTELAGIKAQLEHLSSGGAKGPAEAVATGTSSVDKLSDVLARHLQAVNAAIEEAQTVRAAQPAPPVLGDFTIPTSAEIKDMTSFVQNDDEVTTDLLKVGELSQSFKTGLTDFTTFYGNLSPEQRKDFQLLNEKGIQPFSDKVVTPLVKGINQWTIGLRDDVDKRINLLVASANEMQRTMKNIHRDYVEFLVSSTDPAAKVVSHVNKILSGVEKDALATYNNLLTYVQQVMENLMSTYDQQLQKQKEALDAKELKNISKAIENLKKSIK
jgi:proteasome lid subunit RPN8/RPN11